MRILHVVGARPNFVKLAPIWREIDRTTDWRQTIVHTGQHYDREMSEVFFEEFGLPEPDANLGIGSGSHAVQTAKVMERLDQILDQATPDWVVVYGDVNSTLAAALVAAKRSIRVVHVEAGLRSYDRTMPEEINRVLTDHVADLLFTPSRDADVNLRNEGIPSERICRVGNVMIDTLEAMLPRIGQQAQALRDSGACPEWFVLATFHRPANVESPVALAEIMGALGEIGRDVPVVFPAHPRTQTRLRDFGVLLPQGVTIVAPMGYVDFLSHLTLAGAVLTDSGGVQEETTYAGIPCLTVRPNTERPVTLTLGTNRLVVANRVAIVSATREALEEPRRPVRPDLWDGKAAKRIVDNLLTQTQELAGHV